MIWNIIITILLLFLFNRQRKRAKQRYPIDSLLAPLRKWQHDNEAYMQSLNDRFPSQKFVFLLSIMADKDVDEMLELLLPLANWFVTVAAHTPRAMPAETLAEHIRAYGCRAEAADSIEAGVARAVELGGEGPVCALGTLYFSGDVRKAFAELVKG